MMRVLAGISHDTGDHSLVARWAVALAEAAWAVIVAGLLLLAGGYLFGGADAVEDTWIGWGSALSIYLGLLTALIAFAGGLVARIQRETWRWLWLPLASLPTMVLLLALGEAFWWE